MERMSKGKEPDPEVGIHIDLPSSLRDKIYNYLDREGGKLKYFFRGLAEDFFEQEDWMGKHTNVALDRRRRKYWDKDI
jgi:hypothetical protein